jgi:hypothetical protein
MADVPVAPPSANGAAPPPESLTATRKRKRDARTVAYERASAQNLANQPSRAVLTDRPPPREWLMTRQHLESRLNMQRAWRTTWAAHWSLLETYLLPRRGIFINNAMPTANSMVRGSPINQEIVDPTGTYAMRVCTAGLVSGLISPSRPWFKLKPALFDRNMLGADAQEWFEECEDRIYTIMGRSNFYDAGAQMMEDIVAFGTGPMIIYEDEDQVIRCYTPCPGEYFVSSSNAMRVGSLYRLFVMTISQIVQMFGLENCPQDVQKMWQEKGGQIEVEKLVAHAIEPNFPIATSSQEEVGVVQGDYAWREAYWIYGSGAEWPLSWRGFMDEPFICPRWAVTSNDAYGRSVAMEVLPDIIQLQVMTNRMGEAIEKMVRPPLLASADMKNEPSSILPGHITYVTSLDASKGMRPTYTVNPEIKEMMENLQAIQARIKTGFFNDLFLMLETASNKNMTAFEVAQRQQEKLQVLGPVIERLQNEALGPAIKRIFRIMERKGLLPPMPASLRGVKMGIEYQSMLSLAQKAASTASLERWASVMGNMQAADPSIADVWDRDAWAEEYSHDILLPRRIMNSPEKVQQLREARAKQMQQQQAMGAAQAAVEGAKTLSETQLGSGQNALALMMGNQGLSGVTQQ